MGRAAVGLRNNCRKSTAIRIPFHSWLGSSLHVSFICSHCRISPQSRKLGQQLFGSVFFNNHINDSLSWPQLEKSIGNFWLYWLKPDSNPQTQQVWPGEWGHISKRSSAYSHVDGCGAGGYLKKELLGKAVSLTSTMVILFFFFF